VRPGRKITYVGTAVAIAIMLVWVAAGQPIAGIAFGQGFALGIAVLFVAFVVDRAKGRH
jgi:hypothetical protein